MRHLAAPAAISPWHPGRMLYTVELAVRPDDAQQAFFVELGGSNKVLLVDAGSL